MNIKELQQITKKAPYFSGRDEFAEEKIKKILDKFI